MIHVYIICVDLIKLKKNFTKFLTPTLNSKNFGSENFGEILRISAE